MARSDESLALASRHLDPSLVDVLRILGFDKRYASARGSYLYDADGRAYLDFHTGEGFASLGHNHPDVREVLEAPLAADLVDGVQLHYSALAGMLAQALSRAAAGGARCRVLREHRRRGGRLGDEVRARRDAAAAAALLRHRASTASRSDRCRWSATTSSRRASARCCPGCAARARSATSRAWRQSFASGDVAAFIVEPIQGRTVDAAARRSTCRQRRSSAAATGRCSCSTRSRPGSGAPALVRARALGARAGLRARRQGAQRRLHAGCRDGHAPRDLSSARSERSSAATCTSRRSGATACRWRPGWRRCGSSSATACVDHVGADRRACCSTASRSSAGPPRDGQGGPRTRADDRDRARRARARGSRRLNWRLIHMASEGLFPQLVVIPLHRDHGVITMAAGKNDVIKLLPPLTLSERRGATASSTRSTRCSAMRCGASKNWARGARHRDRRRCAAGGRPGRRAGGPELTAPRARGGRIPRDADRPLARRYVPGHGRDRLHRRSSGAASRAARAGRCAASSGEQRHVAARAARRRARGRRPGELRIARARGGRLPPRVPLRRARVGLGDHRGDRAHQRDRHAQHPRGSVDGGGRTLHPLQHHRRIRLSRWAPRSTRPIAPTRFRNWYAQTKLQAEAEVRRAGEASDAGDGDPAPVHRLRPAFDGCRRRDRARDPRRQACCSSTAAAPSRGSATSTTWSTRRCSRCTRSRAGPRVQRERRPRGHLEAVHRRARRRSRLRGGPLEPALLAGDRCRLLARAGLPRRCAAPPV